MQSGDLVFVECTLSDALRSHRCGDGCPTRGLAVILDIAVEGQVQVLDSDGTYWIWPEDCHTEWEINEVTWIEDFCEAG